jgi:hypothetical protein
VRVDELTRDAPFAAREHDRTEVVGPIPQLDPARLGRAHSRAHGQDRRAELDVLERKASLALGPDDALLVARERQQAHASVEQARAVRVEHESERARPFDEFDVHEVMDTVRGRERGAPDEAAAVGEHRA